jgi:hypothetical protein
MREHDARPIRLRRTNDDGRRQRGAADHTDDSGNFERR